MFDQEKAQIAEQIKTYLNQQGIEDANIEFRQIPFSGEWGLAVALFPIAAAEAQIGRASCRERV